VTQARPAPRYDEAWTSYPWGETDFATIVATEAANRVLRPLMIAEIRLRDWIGKAGRGELNVPVRPLVVALTALGERQEAARAEIMARVRLHILPPGEPEAALRSMLTAIGLDTSRERDLFLDAALGPWREELLPLLPGSMDS
jgi:hypothetical protein